ncbi:MAG TPA: diaminopimelate epimerase [Candidatus Kapabacteria bacterium]|nr:diaminopimelate epimerase [Candidatus Kapabacteria bacterium]
MKIPFKKMSGAGNDFIVVDNRDHKLPDLESVTRNVCNRSNAFGGADGFIAIENSGKAEFEMKYFNADGSTGAMCGNGGRCAARFALVNGIVPSKHVLFEAVGSIYRADVTGDRVRLAMPDPRAIRLNFKLSVRGQQVTCHYVNVETPHAVIFIKDIIAPQYRSVDDLDINGWGKDVRMHPDFSPEGANANFAELLNDGTVKLRTFERGVEGETLACGTGSVATAIVAHLLHKIAPPVHILTKSGETLAVDFSDMNGDIRNLSLEGSANILSEGLIEL